MSRKDSMKFAAMIKSHYDKLPEYLGCDDARLAQVLVEIAEEFAQICIDDNPRFDKSRFMAACGLEDN